jgi:2-polyprenyl-3-methyl-5-hydroxy-6-metoxy-1,4-benzoquinol methylase
MVTNLFNEKANSWSDRYTSALINRLLAFQLMLTPYAKSHKLLLDVGCATGIMLKMAHDIGFSVKGIDLSPQMIAVCKENLNTIIPDLNVKCGVLEEEKSELSKVDVILCSSVFEYLAEPESYLHLFHSYLNDNGIVLITIPNTKNLIRMIEFLLKNIFKIMPFFCLLHPKVHSYKNYLSTSKNRYSEKNFLKIVSEHGFSIKKKVYLSKDRQYESNNFLKATMLLYTLAKVSNLDCKAF